MFSGFDNNTEMSVYIQENAENNWNLNNVVMTNMTASYKILCICGKYIYCIANV